ncbi:hypothetical protein J4Q44_G00063750 [Coregonus suidteri]|uniref:Uncharacterized protein n=1 Tax=Coregonus suidteri TaxID=861788 RepID=A0AAN8R3W8_9TELE
MEWSGGVEKGGGIVRVNVKKKRKPEEPLPVLSEESSDEGGSGRSVVLREVEFKVMVKCKDQGGVQAVSPIALARDLESKVGEVVSAKVIRDGSLVVVCFSMRRRSNSSSSERS